MTIFRYQTFSNHLSLGRRNTTEILSSQLAHGQHPVKKPLRSTGSGDDRHQPKRGCASSATFWGSNFLAEQRRDGRDGRFSGGNSGDLDDLCGKIREKSRLLHRLARKNVDHLGGFSKLLLHPLENICLNKRQKIIDHLTLETTKKHPWYWFCCSREFDVACLGAWASIIHG